jgi:RNA polymerase primary sigma factor
MRKHPRLSRGDEVELAGRIQDGEEDAVGELVTPNMAYVAKIARQYARRGVPFEDLLHEGALGLMEAARRFDPDREIRFVVYAAWWIRKYMNEALFRQSRQIVPPKRRPILDNGERGYHPLKEVSLDADVGPDTDVPLRDMLCDPEDLLADDHLVHDEMGSTVAEAVAGLEPVERFVVERRYGLDGQEASTLRDIGHEMGVTRERVRQIEIRAKDKIRRHLLRLRPSGCRWNFPTV